MLCTPFNQTVIGQTCLVQADCFSVFPHIQDRSVDAIVADLPYGSTAKCLWDIPLDLPALWVQYKRILKPNGVVLLFAQTPFDKVLGCSNLPWLRYEWIWEKTEATGFFNAHKMPLKAHENILVFYQKTPKFNPQKTSGHSPVHSFTKRIPVADRTLVYGNSTREISGGGSTERFPRSVQRYATDKQKNRLDGTIHPTQKPLALLKMLVSSYTNENDLVLDNVTGSGTTNVACLELNRRSIGIEKNADYYALAVRRCKKVRHENNAV